MDCGGVCDAPCDRGSSAGAWMARQRTPLIATSTGAALVCLAIAALAMHRAHRRHREVAHDSGARVSGGGSVKVASPGAPARGRQRVKSVAVMPWAGDSETPVRRLDARRGGTGSSTRTSSAGDGHARSTRGSADWLATATPVSPRTMSGTGSAQAGAGPAGSVASPSLCQPE